MLEHFESLKPPKGKPYFGRIRDGKHYGVLAGDKKRKDTINRREAILLELERREKAKEKAKEEAAAAALSDAMQTEPPRCIMGLSAPPKMKAIAARVLAKHGKHWTDVFSTSRKQEICEVRFEIWSDMKDVGYSLQQIGRLFNKDHTTVLSGIRRHNGGRRERHTTAA